jgi:formylglycine-generating enzyme required for sulfatase activity
MHEVTIASFCLFETSSSIVVQRQRRLPANNITWFDAAACCRWISEQEGLPEDQMCYPPIAKIGPGIRLPDDWRGLLGYRLPTEAEWEYACRGGVQASRYMGDGKKLLSRYAWFIENSDDHAWPVGRLKPNSFGLFDMQGNVTERCLEPLLPYPDGTAKAAADSPVDFDLKVEESSMRDFRGNFATRAHPHSGACRSCY